MTICSPSSQNMVSAADYFKSFVLFLLLAWPSGAFGDLVSSRAWAAWFGRTPEQLNAQATELLGGMLTLLLLYWCFVFAVKVFIIRKLGRSATQVEKGGNEA